MCVPGHAQLFVNLPTSEHLGGKDTKEERAELVTRDFSIRIAKLERNPSFKGTNDACYRKMHPFYLSVNMSLNYPFKDMISIFNSEKGCGEYPSDPMLSLTPVLVESQIQRLSETTESMIPYLLMQIDPKLPHSKKRMSQELEYVMNMPEDDPRRMDEIRKYAAIYGRFDCKRKAEKPLTLHEVSVNEAAAQICKHIPALLTRRDELFPLARQVVRDSGYQYSKGHSRSQMYNKSFDEETCKRLRLDASPGQANDKTQLDEERKKRQERLEAISEQLKLLGSQQEELKTRLQQAREVQNYAAVTHLQTQLDQISAQQMQLINDQSDINKQLRRIERYYLGGKGCGRLSSCSDPDKIDNDDTDSQFSAYSNASSPTLSHDAHDSPSQDSNQSAHTTDVFGTMKMVKKTSVQITKQLVQETLIDEGLRVVKELANQIKEDCEISALAPPNVSPPRNNSSGSSTTSNGPTPNVSNSSKPEAGSRPRGRPPRLDRDYSISTASATGGGSRAPTPMSHPPPASTPSPSTTNNNSNSNNGGNAPTSSPSAQNGRTMSSSAMNGPACSSEPHNNSSASIPISASSHSVDGFVMPMTNGTNGLSHHHHHQHHHQHGSGGSNSPVVDITSSPEPMGKGASNSLNALLAFSQKGIKQEPSSPNNAYKID
ncbi:NGFI-A-binding protein homolog [Caerostris darwini]|uniref:NGFI-A-binding protein homolog n=1 Tax=Caerostris darwini TaxID=1538125 RepID=A0AAV4S357_9ARAC|nr:NGFI-A-binding protein homolog [Caerostris darwini]